MGFEEQIGAFWAKRRTYLRTCTYMHREVCSRPGVGCVLEQKIPFVRGKGGF